MVFDPEQNVDIPDMGDHFMADHIEHDEDFNWNEDVKPLWKPQEISAGEYMVVHWISRV